MAAGGGDGAAGRQVLRAGVPPPGASSVQEVVSTIYPFRVRSLADAALLAEYRKRLAGSYAPLAPGVVDDVARLRKVVGLGAADFVLEMIIGLAARLGVELTAEGEAP
ncbi:hypothetical protein [Pigmentiphaga sp. D-2]|uniref:hypothetical protein n=1 Tax=Pigmentiphaga sp. D-2 TaxID=1002116 RepID=UPI00104C1525|nr:hypothetical protein [Pigmentiphaga sp. D-2]